MLKRQLLTGAGNVPFGFSGWEILVVLVIVLLIFGVGRLPEVGNSLGKGLREFRRAVSGGDGETKAGTDKADAKAKPKRKAAVKGSKKL
jgi:sec-independent protein translocase protein TatA